MATKRLSSKSLNGFLEKALTNPDLYGSVEDTTTIKLDDSALKMLKDDVRLLFVFLEAMNKIIYNSFSKYQPIYFSSAVFKFLTGDLPLDGAGLFHDLNGQSKTVLDCFLSQIKGQSDTHPCLNNSVLLKLLTNKTEGFLNNDLINFSKLEEFSALSRRCEVLDFYSKYFSLFLNDLDDVISEKLNNLKIENPIIKIFLEISDLLDSANELQKVILHNNLVALDNDSILTIIDGFVGDSSGVRNKSINKMDLSLVADLVVKMLENQDIDLNQKINLIKCVTDGKDSVVCSIVIDSIKNNHSLKKQILNKLEDVKGLQYLILNNVFTLEEWGINKAKSILKDDANKNNYTLFEEIAHCSTEFKLELVKAMPIEMLNWPKLQNYFEGVVDIDTFYRVFSFNLNQSGSNNDNKKILPHLGFLELKEFNKYGLDHQRKLTEILKEQLSNSFKYDRISVDGKEDKHLLAIVINLFQGDSDLLSLVLNNNAINFNHIDFQQIKMSESFHKILANSFKNIINNNTQNWGDNLFSITNKVFDKNGFEYIAKTIQAEALQIINSDNSKKMMDNLNEYEAFISKLPVNIFNTEVNQNIFNKILSSNNYVLSEKQVSKLHSFVQSNDSRCLSHLLNFVKYNPELKYNPTNHLSYKISEQQLIQSKGDEQCI